MSATFYVQIGSCTILYDVIPSKNLNSSNISDCYTLISNKHPHVFIILFITISRNIENMKWASTISLNIKSIPGKLTNNLEI